MFRSDATLGTKVGHASVGKDYQVQFTSGSEVIVEVLHEGLP